MRSTGRLLHNLPLLSGQEALIKHLKGSAEKWFVFHYCDAVELRYEQINNALLETFRRPDMLARTMLELSDFKQGAIQPTIEYVNEVERLF